MKEIADKIERPVKTYCGGVPHYVKETDIVERLHELETTWFEMCGDIHIPIKQAADEIESLRQQLVACEQALAERQANLERERQRRWDGNRLASLEYAELSRELAECQAREQMRVDAFTVIAKDYRDIYDADYELYYKLTMDFETIEDALALPSDSTALDTMLAAAELKGRREALLDAKHVAENMMALGYKIEAIVGDISNMAKELE
jgi:hypothetical protein